MREEKRQRKPPPAVRRVRREVTILFFVYFECGRRLARNAIPCLEFLSSSLWRTRITIGQIPVDTRIHFPIVIINLPVIYSIELFIYQGDPLESSVLPISFKKIILFFLSE